MSLLSFKSISNHRLTLLPFDPAISTFIFPNISYSFKSSVYYSYAAVLEDMKLRVVLLRFLCSRQLYCSEILFEIIFMVFYTFFSVSAIKRLTYPTDLIRLSFISFIAACLRCANSTELPLKN